MSGSACCAVKGPTGLPALDVLDPLSGAEFSGKLLGEPLCLSLIQKPVGTDMLAEEQESAIHLNNPCGSETFGVSNTDAEAVWCLKSHEMFSRVRYVMVHISAENFKLWE